MKRIIALLMALCLGMSVVLLTSCGDDDDYEYDNDYDYDYDYKYVSPSISSSQAINYAKQSKRVQDEIADLYGMKFYYTPDWGTATAEEDHDSWNEGGWEVEIKGTISGYTDDYKSDFEYDKKFSVKVTLDSTGNVDYVLASRY